MNTYSSGLQIARFFFFFLNCVFPGRPLHFIRGKHDCTRSIVLDGAEPHACMDAALLCTDRHASTHFHIYAQKLWIQSKAKCRGTHLMTENVEEAWNSISDSLSGALSPPEFYSSFNNLNRSHVIAIQAVNIAQSDAARCCKFKWCF